MTPPADDEIRFDLGHQHARVAQDVEDDVGQALAGVGIEDLVEFDLVFDVRNVTQHCEQLFLDAGYHAAVDKGTLRCVFDLELDAAFLLDDANFEIPVLLEYLTRIVGLAVDVQHRQCATAKGFIEAIFGRALFKLRNLELRQDVHLSARRQASDFGVLVHVSGGEKCSIV